jgi:hypothetical protein
MKHFAFIVFFVLALFYVRPGYSDETELFVEDFESGAIDWTNGIITAKGIAVRNSPGGDVVSMTLPLTKAINRARENLVNLVYGIRIDATTSPREIGLTDRTLHEKIVRMVESAFLTNRETLPDGSVEARIELPFSGGFSQLLLPSEITRIESIKPTTPMNGDVFRTVEMNGEPADRERSKSYSGLVVDATGLKALPALAPKILDERGGQVYGALYVSREYAIKQGVCGYARNLQAALTNRRVADNPLLVKGLRTNGPASSDIVVSNADASKIRGSSQNLTFLKRCRVIIVLD